MDEENVHLLQFLTVMESILCHGLKREGFAYISVLLVCSSESTAVMSE